MVKVNELRIGNLLLWNTEHAGGGISKVISVTEIGYKIKSQTGCHPSLDEYKDIEPIPLTPEWLERCGFAENDRGYYVLVSGGFYLLKNDLKDETGAIDGFALVAAGSHGLVQKPIYKHLHQLQNLFFALTGEELNVKL